MWSGNSVVGNMADSSTDELKPPSATKDVLERFHMHIDKFS